MIVSKMNSNDTIIPIKRVGQMENTKFTGVTFINGKNGVKTFYIGYMSPINNKWKRIKVGTSANGCTAAFANQIRLKKLNEQAGELFDSTNDTLTMNDVKDSYFNARTFNNPNRVKSIKNDMNIYKKHIEPLFGEFPIIKLIKKDIVNLKAKKVALGLAPQTVNNILTALSSIINYGINEMDLNIKNYIGKSVKKLKVSNKRERYLLKDEILALLNKLKDKPVLLLFIKLALFTGARVQALLHIQVKDISTDGVIQLNDFKNGSRYTGYIDINSIDLSILKDLSPNNYIIGGKDTPLADTTVAKPLRLIFNLLFNQGLEKYDRKQRVTIHTLRHTYASQLVIAGTSIYTVSKMLNHSSVQVSERYAKLAPNAGAEDARNFARSIMSKENSFSS